MHDRDFRRLVRNIVNDKFDGDIYDYIKSLYDTIDIMESQMNALLCVVSDKELHTETDAQHQAA